MKIKKKKINRITIATPFYNEENGLDYFFNTLFSIKKLLNQLNVDVSFLFINDGSIDGTKIKLEKFKKKNKFLNIKIVNHKKNFGYGRTIKTSFLNCKTDYLITYDSDCSYDYKIIKNLIESIGNGVDIVNVSYKLAKGNNDLSFFRKILSWGASTLYRFFFRSIRKNLVTVFTCSYRIYCIKKIKDIKIKSDDFASCSELLIKSLLNGIKVKEIPGINNGRKYGESKMKIFKNIISTIKIIILIKLNY